MNKDKRKAAFDAARALVELEDFMVPNHTFLMAAKYTKDEISLQDLIVN